MYLFPQRMHIIIFINKMKVQIYSLSLPMVFILRIIHQEDYDNAINDEKLVEGLVPKNKHQMCRSVKLFCLAQIF